MNEDIKFHLRNSAYLITQQLIIGNIPFSLILWNKNNWDNPLPTQTMEDFPLKLLLHFDEEVISSCDIDEDGVITFSYMFEDELFSKELEFDEIFAVTNPNNEPYIVCNFRPDNKSEKSKEEILSMITQNGISDKDAKKSLSVFLNKD